MEATSGCSQDTASETWVKEAAWILTCMCHYDNDLEITDEREDSDHYLDTEEIEDSSDEDIVGDMKLSHSLDLQKLLGYLLVPKQNQKGREEGKVRNQVRLMERRLKGKVKVMSARDQVLYL